MQCNASNSLPNAISAPIHRTVPQKSLPNFLNCFLLHFDTFHRTKSHSIAIAALNWKTLIWIAPDKTALLQQQQTALNWIAFYCCVYNPTTTAIRCVGLFDQAIEIHPLVVQGHVKWCWKTIFFCGRKKDTFAPALYLLRCCPLSHTIYDIFVLVCTNMVAKPKYWFSLFTNTRLSKVSYLPHGRCEEAAIEEVTCC